MKFSLSWIFDHIVCPNEFKLTESYARELVKKLSLFTTEIDNYSSVFIDLEKFTLAQCHTIDGKQSILYSPELKIDFRIDIRKDEQIGRFYLCYKKDQWQYAKLSDLSIITDKDGFFPEMWCRESEIAGAWKQRINRQDFIFTVDNKSITHRSDLWSHRGFAREIAALYSMQLQPETQLFAELPLHQENELFPANLHIDPHACSQLAVSHIAHVTIKGSLPWMSIRLALVESRPIHSFVDSTNYVMFDIGQPMHVFDEQMIEGGSLSVRKAHAGETIELLNREKKELTDLDVVIADGKKICGLAGIMGGRTSAVFPQTKNVVIESATFYPQLIRASSLRHNIRSESSSRFEKGLDKQQPIKALQRFIKIMNDYLFTEYKSPTIMVLGTPITSRSITFSHEWLEKMMGMKIETKKVIKILDALEFFTQYEKQSALYTVTIPSFRFPNDTVLKEDILEEVARFIGYNNITPQLPERSMQLFDIQLNEKIKKIKQHCSHGLQMHEFVGYPFYDEELLRIVPFEILSNIYLKNPVSDRFKRMNRSLFLNLFSVILHNQNVKSMNFFEINNVWDISANGSISETKKLALLLFHQEPFNFYKGKTIVQSIFDFLPIDVTWHQVKEKLIDPWFFPPKTAQLSINDHIIGYAGIITPLLEKQMGGSSFFAEIDLDFLIKTPEKQYYFHPISKYQKNSFDISMIVPNMITVGEIKQACGTLDTRITEVELIDFYEQADQDAKRHITLRFIIVDHHKTIDKQDLDSLYTRIKHQLIMMNIIIR